MKREDGDVKVYCFEKSSVELVVTKRTIDRLDGGFHHDDKLRYPYTSVLPCCKL